MVNPATAWSDAEKHVFNKLVTDTKSKAGATAFRSDILPPGVFQCWRLNTGGGDARQTWAGCYGGLSIGGEIEGRFKDRDEAMAFIGRVMQTLNEQGNFNKPAGTNIQWFRIADGGLPTVERTTFFPANGKGAEVTCHIVRMGVQLVYNLSTTY